jgi:lipopolysaccharide transport system ATP-binding protein
VKQLSNRAIFLMNGRMEAQGEPRDVINRYIGMVLGRGDSTGARRNGEGVHAASHRHGDGSSEILGVAILNRNEEPVTSVASGEPVTIRVTSRFQQAKSDPMVGILIRTRIGMDVYGTNTRIEQIELGDFAAGDEVQVDFQFECWLTPQQYTLTVATQNADGSSHDWLDDVVAFDVVDTRSAAGVSNLRAKVTWRASR